MPDTQRTVAAVLALLADNSSGDITPQDIRDAFVSWQPGHGQISVPASASAACYGATLPNTTAFHEVTNPVWYLSTGGRWFDESDGNGRLTYTGAEDVHAHIVASISFSGAANDTTRWRLGINGTTDVAGEMVRKVGSGGDVGSSAFHLMAMLSPGDHISLWIKNDTATDDPILEAANLQAMTMPV